MINIIQKEIDNLSTVRTKFVQEIENKQEIIARISKEIAALDKSVKNIDKSIASLYATISDLETDTSLITDVPQITDTPVSEPETQLEEEYTDTVTEEIEYPVLSPALVVETLSEVGYDIPTSFTGTLKEFIDDEVSVRDFNELVRILAEKTNTVVSEVRNYLSNID